MDWFDGSSAPAEYQAVAWIADLAQLGQGLGWAINYATMAHRSYQESTYGMSILPLCCNFAWELVYTFIYPPHNPVEKFNITLYLILNVFIMSFAVRFAPREWSHAPMVQRNIPLIFLFGTIAFILAHIALAKTAGAGLAANWGAFFCLELLIAGAWCQLLGRGSSRGTSYTIWAARFVGSYIAAISVELRRIYWPQEFSWLEYPMVKWHMGVCIFMDVGYVFALRHIRKRERLAASQDQKKTKKN